MPSYITPFHPAVVHFPIALFLFSVALNLAGRYLHGSRLAFAGKITLYGAAAGGILSVILGYIDEERFESVLSPDVLDAVHLHMWFGIAYAAALLLLALYRWFLDSRGQGSERTFLLASLAGVLLAIVQGWLGGELVFAHGVGVMVQDQMVQTQESAPPAAQHQQP